MSEAAEKAAQAEQEHAAGLARVADRITRVQTEFGTRIDAARGEVRRAGETIKAAGAEIDKATDNFNRAMADLETELRTMSKLASPVAEVVAPLPLSAPAAEEPAVLPDWGRIRAEAGVNMTPSAPTDLGQQADNVATLPKKTAR